MRNELIKDLERAIETKFPVTAINLDCMMKVESGEIASMRVTQDGRSITIKGEEFHLSSNDNVECKLNGGKKYYRLTNEDFAEWELVIII